MSVYLHRFYSKTIGAKRARCGFAKKASMSAFAVLLICLFVLAGCSSVPYDKGNSPELVSKEFFGFNEGSFDKQYIKAVLTFDKEIKADGFIPKVKIAGSNIKGENMEVEADGETLSITIQIEKIRDADMELVIGDSEKSSVPEITDVTGKYAISPFTIKTLVPSGVVIEPVTDGSNEGNGLTVNIAHAFNIRSIAWILFTDGGETVTGSLLGGADEKNGAVALHGHEFIDDDEYDVAANLADTLTNHFGDRYEFTVEATTVTVKSKEDENAKLEIKVYENVELK